MKSDPKIIELSHKLNEHLSRAPRRPAQFGIFDDVPQGEYHEWDAYGSGDVRRIGHSPAHFREDWRSGRHAKLITGRAFHACVLEPDTEWRLYQRLPDGTDRRHKAFKDASEEHGSDYVLTAREYDSCLGGRKVLLTHSRIKKLLESGRPEVSYAWKDGATGLALKGRSDWVSESWDTTIDLKQTGDAREHSFRRVAVDKAYPVQGVHYLSGLNAHGLKLQHYTIVAIECDPPYAAILYRISSKDMLIAEAHWRALVDKLAWCVERDEWPGYPERTQVLHMGPYWESDVQGEIASLQESMT